MIVYQNLISHILTNGVEKGDRTGTGTISVFGPSMRFDLEEGFPMVTTKRVPFKSVLSELLWFIEGSDDERRLAEILYGKDRKELIGKTTIWTANADAQGKALGYRNDDHYKGLGPVYGVQWRYWTHGIDQLSNLISGIKNDPDGRRHILTAWNVEELDKMALPPCHCFAQFYVANGKLSCHLYQRSADVALGVPFNIASYAIFTHMIAQECGLGVGDLVHTMGDAHIYMNHIDQCKEILNREPLELPTIWLNPDVKRVVDFKMDDIKVIGYNHHQTIKMDMAV